MIALAKVDAVIGARNLAAPRVDDIALYTKAINGTDAGGRADRTFRCDAASIQDVALENARRNPVCAAVAF